MKCFYCNGDMEEGTTTHAVTLKDCVVVVKDVPCTRCKQCGEAYFSDRIADELERIMDSFRKTKTEIAVVSYAAAQTGKP